MKKNCLIILLIFSFVSVFSQQTNRWTDLFSYNNVLQMVEDEGKIIAATENGIFYYTVSTGEISKLSKANGLHEVKISAFDYNPDTNVGLVGYANGSMDVITPEGITFIVDIPLASGYAGSKRINHISITGDKAVISVDYGVSIFNLTTKEFGDSAFFITAGIYEAAKEAVIKGTKVFAVTSSGLKSHEMNVSFPVYSTWTTLQTGNYTQIDAKEKIAFSSNNQVYYGDGATFALLPQGFVEIKDVVVTSQHIIVTDASKTYVFNTSGAFVKLFDAEEPANTALFYNNQIFIGTQFSGILNEQKASFKPDGPYSNISYKISLLGDEIYVATGGREESYNASIDRDMGYYHFNGMKWIYPEFFINNPLKFNILDVVPNPAKPTEVFFTNYNSQNINERGLYKMNNNEFVSRYNHGSSAWLDRTVGIVFDENNLLLCSVAYFTEQAGIGLYSISGNNFQSSLITTTAGAAVQKPVVSDGYLWFAAPRNGGLLRLKYNKTQSTSDDTHLVFTKAKNNLTTNDVIAVCIDKTDDAWIGTNSGLRVLNNANNATETSQTEPVIITQNNIPEELFKDLVILQIEVDSGNQKWISIDGGGVYYLTSNGEKTLLNFNKSNSPLPSNTVTDIKVDERNGKVYFVTLDGIVVYQGDVANVTSNFGDVLVYPNPVITSQYKGNVKIRGLAEKTNIRITDAAGNLIHQKVVRGGYYEWNLNNQNGKRVSSGVYFVLMTNEDGTDTKTAKIAVVN